MTYRPFASLAAGARIAFAAEDDAGADTETAPETQNGEATEAGADTEDGETQPLAAEGAPGEDVGVEGEPEAEPPRKRVPWQQKRIDKLTAEKSAAEERATQLKAEADESRRQAAAYQALYGVLDGTTAADPPARAPVQPTQQDGPRTYTEKEVETLVAQRANLKALDDRMNASFDRGVAKHGDAFKQRALAAGQAFGDTLKNRIDFFEALAEFDNAEDVYHELTGDLDRFGEVLDLSPVKLGVELAKISAKAGATPAPKAVSRVAAPITPIGGNGSAETDLDKVDMAEYDRIRAKQRAERAQERGH